MREDSKICHRKFSTKKRDNVIEKSLSRGCENDIINIKKKIGDIGIAMKDKERGVRKRGSKAYCLNEGGKMLKPGTRSLFKTI
jgi:hypothetical protein